MKMFPIPRYFLPFILFLVFLLQDFVSANSIQRNCLIHALIPNLPFSFFSFIVLCHFLDWIVKFSLSLFFQTFCHLRALLFFSTLFGVWKGALMSFERIFVLPVRVLLRHSWFNMIEAFLVVYLPIFFCSVMTFFDTANFFSIYRIFL